MAKPWWSFCYLDGGGFSSYNGSMFLQIGENKWEKQIKLF